MDNYSKKVYQIVNYYFDGNKSLIKDYFWNGMADVFSKNPIRVLTSKFVKQSLSWETLKAYEKRMSLSKKEIKDMEANNRKERKRVLPLSDNDLIYSKNGHYYRLTNSVIDLHIRDNIDKYLYYHTTIQYRIKWLIEHKTDSDSNFAKAIGLNLDKFNALKKHKLNVDKLPLGIVVRILHYYWIFVNRHNDNEPMECNLTKKDLDDMQHESPDYYVIH